MKKYGLFIKNYFIIRSEPNIEFTVKFDLDIGENNFQQLYFETSEVSGTHVVTQLFFYLNL